MSQWTNVMTREVTPMSPLTITARYTGKCSSSTSLPATSSPVIDIQLKAATISPSVRASVPREQTTTRASNVPDSKLTGSRTLRIIFRPMRNSDGMIGFRNSETTVREISTDQKTFTDLGGKIHASSP